MSSGSVSDNWKIMSNIEPVYYHSIDLPDGFHPGGWDCREVVDAYLGRVDFAGKTVLEIGPANGFFTFEMERRGASVTCLDLGQNSEWDLVPGKYAQLQQDVRCNLAQIEVAFWKAHGALRSKARMVYGRVYDVPKLTSAHQIGTIGNVLQHLRDPVGALMALAERVTETIVVTETLWADYPVLKTDAAMLLVPRAHIPEVCQTWWQVSSPLVKEVLKMLGFPYLSVEYYSPLLRQDGEWKPIKHMTWVGRRQQSASGIDGCFLSGFSPVEHHDNMSWVWAAGPSAAIEVSIPKGMRSSLQMRIVDAVPQVTMRVSKGGSQIAVMKAPKTGQEFSFPLEGASEPISLMLTFDRWNGHPESFASADPRPLAVSFSSIRIATDRQEIELVV